MADEAYLSYEQVLQELQVNRSELNRLIRDGRLKDHVISGETKFRRVEVIDLKKVIQKRPTVMAEEGEGGAEPTTDVLMAGVSGAVEPETEILEGEPVERETDVLGERPSPLQERDTEVLEEEGEPELELEMPGEGDLQLERPLAEATPLSESALETDLQLEAVRSKAAAPKEEEEDFFDFTEALQGEEFELEGAESAKASEAAAPKAAAPKAPAPKAAAPREEADELVGDILGLDEEAAGGEVSEEELLSEIMDIEGAEEPEDETADITADITTMEEPTYEATELEDVLAGGKEEGFAEEFEIPYAAPIGAEAQATKWMVAALVASVVLLVLGGLFMVENGIAPGITSSLTRWALSLSGS
jgi:hypothetical protein